MKVPGRDEVKPVVTQQRAGTTSGRFKERQVALFGRE